MRFIHEGNPNGLPSGLEVGVQSKFCTLTLYSRRVHGCRALVTPDYAAGLGARDAHDLLQHACIRIACEDRDAVAGLVPNRQHFIVGAQGEVAWRTASTGAAPALLHVACFVDLEPHELVDTTRRCVDEAAIIGELHVSSAWCFLHLKCAWHILEQVPIGNRRPVQTVLTDLPNDQLATDLADERSIATRWMISDDTRT